MIRLMVVTFVAVSSLLLATPLSQAETLVVTKTGYYLLSQDAAGNPVLTKISTVIVLGDAPPPGPDPTNPAEAQHRAAVRTATTKVTDPNKANIKLALSKLYQTVAGLPVTERSQLVTSTDLLFNALALGDPWKIWKAEVDASLARFVALDDAKRGWLWVSEVLAEK